MTKVIIVRIKKNSLRGRSGTTKMTPEYFIIKFKKTYK